MVRPSVTVTCLGRGFRPGWFLTLWFWAVGFGPGTARGETDPAPRPLSAQTYAHEIMAMQAEARGAWASAHRHLLLARVYDESSRFLRGLLFQVELARGRSDRAPQWGPLDLEQRLALALARHDARDALDWIRRGLVQHRTTPAWLEATLDLHRVVHRSGRADLDDIWRTAILQTPQLSTLSSGPVQVIMRARPDVAMLWADARASRLPESPKTTRLRAWTRRRAGAYLEAAELARRQAILRPGDPIALETAIRWAGGMGLGTAGWVRDWRLGWPSHSARIAEALLDAGRPEWATSDLPSSLPIELRIRMHLARDEVGPAVALADETKDLALRRKTFEAWIRSKVEGTYVGPPLPKGDDSTPFRVRAAWAAGHEEVAREILQRSETLGLDARARLHPEWALCFGRAAADDRLERMPLVPRQAWTQRWRLMARSLHAPDPNTLRWALASWDAFEGTEAAARVAWLALWTESPDRAKRAVAMDPDEPRAIEAWIRHGDDSEAPALSDFAVRRFPHDPGLWWARAEVLRRAGDHERAQRATARGRSESESLIRLGYLVP
ncbi:MAG: hypothetical protein ACFB9M_18525 [Myxococcota bacterium]